MSSKLKKYKVRVDNEKTEAKKASESNETEADNAISREEAERILQASADKDSKKEKKNKDPKTRNKRIVITAAAIGLAFIILYYGITAVGNAIKKKIEADKEKDKPSHIIFFAPDYDEDIEKDTGYIDLDRNFYFEDPSYGTKYAYDTDTLDEVSESYRTCVRTVTDFLMSAIRGDTEGVNSCFSDYYLKNGGKLKDKVAPQKLYDIVISYDGEPDGAFPNTGETRAFWVEYKIRMNNGTFRNDMGSNCVRKEYVCVSVREGKGEIDFLTVYKTGS
ncbi:MAG: hypothetical protein MJ137_04330 [Clostridia bacterium]|nr:hypothetical protein [Clostridia bacterium]